MSLLEARFGATRSPSETQVSSSPASDTRELDINAWLNSGLQLTNSSATTCRFFENDKYRETETAYMLLLNLEGARQALLNGDRDHARRVLQRMDKNFSGIASRMPQYIALKTFPTENDLSQETARARLKSLDFQVSGFVGKPCVEPAASQAGWRPNSWTISGKSGPLATESQPVLMIRATQPNSYWHTDKFVATDPGGKIIVRFDAKCSSYSSLHQMYLFEDETYFSVGEVYVEAEWKTFEVPMTTKIGSVLELQLDQRDSDQWLMIRDFHVVGGADTSSSKKPG